MRKVYCKVTQDIPLVRIRIRQSVTFPPAPPLSGPSCLWRLHPPLVSLHIHFLKRGREEGREEGRDGRPTGGGVSKRGRVVYSHSPLKTLSLALGGKPQIVHQQRHG